MKQASVVGDLLTRRPKSRAVHPQALGTRPPEPCLHGVDLRTLVSQKFALRFWILYSFIEIQWCVNETEA